ncbi:MAG TPA: hypothetical protein VEY50_00860 [Lysobacter sp.]|nr:hypothetical protein [Lysobacter sp.]
MRALFVGGVVDNTELDMDGSEPPLHYPPDTGGGATRYRLRLVGRRDGSVSCAVYSPPESALEDVVRVADERDYSRRFSARLEPVPAP